MKLKEHTVLLLMCLFCVCSSQEGNNIRGPVFVSEPPSTVLFTNNTGSRLECTAFGKPPPVISWLTADDHESIGDVSNLRHVIPNGTLILLPFDPRYYRAEVHARTYICQATNSMGTILSRKIKVNAVIKHTYEVSVNDKDAIKGNTAVMKCEIPTFVQQFVHVHYWLKGARRIRNGFDLGERYSVFPTGELHIRNVRYEDVTQPYQCLTRHELTGEEVVSQRSGRLRLRDVMSLRPAIVDFRTAVSVKVGQKVELPCAAEGSPVPSYKWYYGTKRTEFNVSGRFSQFSGSLIIENVRVGDAGKYVCVATNRLGSADCETLLIVTDSLFATIKPESQTIDVGRPAQFNCTTSGYPMQVPVWLKDGKPLSVDKKRIKLLIPRILMLEEVERQDRGMYQCLIENEEESYQATAELKLGVSRPILHQVFSEQTTQQGSSISLECTASGSPVPDIAWTLDDHPMPPYKRFTVETIMTTIGDVTGRVNISNVRIEDGGLYVCETRNEHGSAKHTARLNVIGVPFIKLLDNVTAVANKDLKVKCYVSGYPIESITWEQDGLKLPLNHRQRVDKDGTLYIQNVQRSQDAGMYTCIARNSQGQGMRRNTFITVQVPPKIDPFEFPKLHPGERTRINCVVSSGDLPITISWVKNGKPIPPGLGIITRGDEFSSSLSISDINPRHDGDYTCIAQNAAASANYTAHLAVDVPPSWSVEPQDIAVVVGESVSMDCIASGVPTPTVLWRKSLDSELGNYVNLTERGSGTYVLSNGTLVIDTATEDAHGYYLCHVSNGVKPDLSKLIFLTVHVSAHFLDSSRQDTAIKDEEVSIECAARGDKPMGMIWIIGGTRLKNIHDNRISKEDFPLEDGMGSRLTINKVKRSDSDGYTCIATNAYGHDSMTINLKIMEKPEAPNNVQVNGYSSRTVQLSWDIPYDGNSPITKYKVEYLNKTGPWQGHLSSAWLNSNITVKTISDLLPSFTYQFRIYAYNALGQSEPSETVAVTTEDEVPAGSPTDIEAGATSSQTILVSWMPPNKNLQNGKLQGYYVGYKIYNSSSPYLYHTVPINDLRQHALTNLNKFTSYSIVVQAFNRRGAGPRSKEVVVRTLEDVPSSPPQGVQTTVLSAMSINVVWLPPSFENLHGILQGYKVLYVPVRDDDYVAEEREKSTTGLTATLYGLEKYTNYSIQVLAYTRMGDGIKSAPVYKRTFQDVPGQPADVKALAASPHSVVITWRKPLHPNGIINKYFIYVKHNDRDGKEKREKIDVSSSQLSYEVHDLRENQEYTFWVSAVTLVGEGEKTRPITQSPSKKIAARIASFNEQIVVKWKDEVVLPCLPVGRPDPQMEWRYNGDVIQSSSAVRILHNGSLYIRQVETRNAGNYTCRVVNVYGADEISHVLIIQAPPSAPLLETVSSTHSSLTLSWKTNTDGGSRIRGITVMMKQEFGEWKTIKINRSNQPLLLSNLACGSKYQIYATVFNRIGASTPSEILVARTNGTAPVKPLSAKLIILNSTSITLNLSSWQNGGCKMKSVVVQYKIYEQKDWTTVANDVLPHQGLFTIHGLHPETFYTLRLTAHNEAGSTTASYNFATLSYIGQTIKPQTVSHSRGVPFYEDISTIVPVVGGVILFLILMVALSLYIKRRRYKHYKYKDTNSMKKDLTAETALIADQLGKNNILRDSACSTSPEHVAAKLDKSENWNVTLKTTADENETEVNPYATYQCQNSPRVTELLDPIMYQNLQVRPIRPPAPLPPEKLLRDEMAKYENQGIVLTPRKYSGPGEIRGILVGNQRNSDLHPSVLERQGTSSASSTDKPQPPRRGIGGVSPVTTVSSNHEELIKAYEQARRHPLPLLERDHDLIETPTVTMHGTDSETDNTEPGLCRFTQSPPVVNEHRESSCMIPAVYSDPALISVNSPRHASNRVSLSSDTTVEHGQPAVRPKRPRRTRSQGSVQQRRSSLNGKSPRHKKNNRHRELTSSSDDEQTTSPSDAVNPYTSNDRDHQLSDIESPEQVSFIPKLLLKEGKADELRMDSPRTLQARSDSGLASSCRAESSPKIIINVNKEDHDVINNGVGDDDNDDNDAGDKGYTDSYTIV